LLFFPKKKKQRFRFEKVQFTNNGAIQLYIAREGSGYSGKLLDPDPAMRSGSDRIRNPAKNYRYLKRKKRR